MRPAIDEDTLLERAISNYLRWAGGFEGMPQQPSRSLSYTEDQPNGILIVLANVHGELARYIYNEFTDRMRKVYVDETEEE